VAACVQCNEPVRDGAAFCGACGAPQPAAVETPEAVARYREVLARFLADGALEPDEHAQLEALRVRLGVSLATHAALFGALEPDSPAPPTIRLSIDVAALRHLATGARGLARFRVENDGALALETVALATRLSGDALPAAEAATLFPGRATVLSIPVTPPVAGFHELTGELRLVDLMGESRRYTFAEIHVRAAGAGPHTQVVHIDQSAARVVDNSRSTFGAGETGGLVGEGTWQPIPLVAARDPAARRTASTNARRAEFAVKTDRATYQVTTTLAQGDLATVYGGHVRGAQPAVRVAIKIADQTSDNDLMQHEVRVLGTLLAEGDRARGDGRTRGPAVHLAAPRDEFRTADGRLGTVFGHLDGFDLTAVRDRCRRRGEPGLPPRHIVWVLRRALAVLGLAHKQGILHGNLDPSHILVRPHDHNVWVIDWTSAVVNPARTGQGFKALNEIYSPPEVRTRGRPTPASDLYALGKCAIHAVGGDPATKELPEMDPRLQRFLRFMTVESQGGRPQDAWELYQQVDRLRTQIWGAHEFVPLEL
jgi:hypothetical protein